MGSILRLMRNFGVLPPYEFAYGTQLPKVANLSTQVHNILSLDFFDPRKTTIEVSGRTGGGIDGLTRYCSSLKTQNPRLQPLIDSLKEIEKIKPTQDAAIRLIDKLVEFRDELRDESKQDEVIVFISFGLKDPKTLELDTKEIITKLVERTDTPKHFLKFTSGHCPSKFLGGNINIYPRLIENTSWYRLTSIEKVDQNRPILEVRFMGLAGVFVYILDQIQIRMKCQFFHLDGESIDADLREILPAR